MYDNTNKIFNLVAFTRARKRKYAKCVSICYSCDKCAKNCFSEEEKQRKAQLAKAQEEAAKQLAQQRAKMAEEKAAAKKAAEEAAKKAAASKAAKKAAEEKAKKEAAELAAKKAAEEKAKKEAEEAAKKAAEEKAKKEAEEKAKKEAELAAKKAAEEKAKKEAELAAKKAAEEKAKKEAEEKAKKEAELAAKKAAEEKAKKEAEEKAKKETEEAAKKAAEEKAKKEAEEKAKKEAEEAAKKAAEEKAKKEAEEKAKKEAEEAAKKAAEVKTAEPTVEPAAEAAPAQEKGFKLTNDKNAAAILPQLATKRARKLIYAPKEALYEASCSIDVENKKNDEGIKVKNILEAEIKEGLKLGYLDKYDGLKMSELKEEYENDTVYELADQEFKKMGLLLDGNDVKVYLFDWTGNGIHHVGYLPADKAAEVKPYLVDIDKYSFDLCGIITGGKSKTITKDEKTGKVTVTKGKDGNYGLDLDITIINRKD